MNSMYETLLGLPLFAAASHERISEVLEKHKIEFLKYTDAQTIVAKNSTCDHVVCILSGSVQVEIETSDRKMRVSQRLDAPDMLALDFLFGRSTLSPATVTSIGNVGVMRISKADFIDIISHDRIFLFNYLNLISVDAQLSKKGILSVVNGSLDKRIAYWIVALTQSSGKDIVLQCRQRDLYASFGVQRQSLVSTLEAMKADDILDFTPQEIRVKNRRKLVELLDRN